MAWSSLIPFLKYFVILKLKPVPIHRRVASEVYILKIKSLNPEPIDKVTL